MLLPAEKEVAAVVVVAIEVAMAADVVVEVKMTLA